MPTKIVVRQQSGIATSTAAVVILRHVITILVFWQLDSECTHLRALQDKMLRRMKNVLGDPTGTPEAPTIRW